MELRLGERWKKELKVFLESLEERRILLRSEKMGSFFHFFPLVLIHKRSIFMTDSNRVLVSRTKIYYNVEYGEKLINHLFGYLILPWGRQIIDGRKLKSKIGNLYWIW